ncbi:unnamed protein product [Triticum aestivum]|uniref:TF-B3 domain-containing protein n=2 Tax=Triticum aestivum TaxID=4565 RepID=A0A9R1JHT6_WHEAT|nr:uncharacterized protein LOC123054294 [Triticum aestivum]KAF7017981.1 hypothetical protein CFC21_031332 [Triticum aestivum]SPT19603.1 unnamed protein product [Triticum aestivum]
MQICYLQAKLNSEEDEHPEYIIRGTPGRIQHCGELDDHCYWGNEVKLYQWHVGALFAMFLRKKPGINYYVCTINKTFAKLGQRMNLLDYIDPHNDTLMVKLANGCLLARCRIMLETDKRTTITTVWSEFRRRANIREGDVCVAI